MRYLLLLFIAVSALTSCKVLKPSVMMKTPRGYKYSDPPKSPVLEYKLAVNDNVQFTMFTNDGFRKVDISGLTADNYTKISAGFVFLIEFDGTSKLPLLKREEVKLAGMTIREAELYLEEKYAAYFNKPFIQLSVTNRRVIVFPGSEGAAKVVTLANEQTTLIEALALAGGLFNTGKAYKIKLIRGDLKNPEVYLIDLSTIDGMKQADLILQANDIIYVEPRLQLGRSIIAEITPYITFITSAIIFYEFVRTR